MKPPDMPPANDGESNQNVDFQFSTKPTTAPIESSKSEERLGWAQVLTLLTDAVLLFTILTACGVRGKPQPPLTPAELGRGKPTFRRGTEEFAFPAVPTPSSVPDRKPTPSEREDNG